MIQYSLRLSIQCCNAFDLSLIASGLSAFGWAPFLDTEIALVSITARRTGYA